MGGWVAEFEFDCEHEPPKIYLVRGGAVVKVFAVPECTHPSGWSWAERDWTLPPLAERLLALLNAPSSSRSGDGEE